MQFLKFLESTRTGFGDFFFSAITNLGDEVFFLALAITFFWCVNKRQGYYILMTGVIGAVVNQWLKIIFRIPRPWINTGLTTVGDPIADLNATGYSFPSGHTQNIAGTLGCIGRYNRQRWVKILSAVVIALVAFSRLYLGVHTPLDVGVSLVIAAILVFSFYFIFRTEEACEKYLTYAITGSVIFSIGFILYVFLIPESGFNAEEIENLMHARENAATLIGCLLGLFVVYPLDKHYIKFETEGRWYAQLIKLGIGLSVNLAIMKLLKQPLVNLLGMYPGRIVRYFLIVMFSGVIWPMTFKYFKKLRISFMENFTEWLVSKFRKNDTV